MMNVYRRDKLILLHYRLILVFHTAFTQSHSLLATYSNSIPQTEEPSKGTRAHVLLVITSRPF